MATARDEFAARGCSVVAVCQAQPELLRPFLDRRPWPVPVVSDPDRLAYRAFGLDRTTWLTFFRPKVLGGYLRGLLKGYSLKKPVTGEDVRQLGGDFLLSRSGEVVYEFRSADPSDRPGVAALLAAVPDGPDL